ncbi:cell division protein ZapA [Methylocapsa aurea]|uniref:cell division protein ZapA n=1 Tax=Methylocapsa aurea TaxID=663610 RepID=UPI00055EC7C9|nr:cell division protein ZapA [Methylocapsa aurea]
MAQVAVTIAGRVYRVACDEGEEAHLGELAHLVDAKVEGMRQRFGEMGDQRLTIMAAITIADELAESHRRIGQLEAELAEVRGNLSKAASGRDEWAVGLAGSLGEAAARIERIAQDLNGAARAEA